MRASLVIVAAAVFAMAQIGCKDDPPVVETGPTAGFSAAPTAGLAPLTVTFTDESDPGTGTITAWQWDFGDGTLASEQNPVHEFAQPGSYTVSLTVTTEHGTDGEVRNDCIVTEAAQMPEAAFSAAPVSGLAPLRVVFTDQSLPGSGPIEFWVWRFGDGASSGEQSPAHEYNSPGTYTVSLSVYTDYGNDTEEKTALVQVNTLAPPAAAFNASPVQGEPPLTVQFTDASTPGDAPISSWLWHFGDGVTSAEQNPAYTYAESGFYTVSLTVTSSAGSNTARKRDYIVVGTPRAKTWLQIYDVAVPFSVVAATPDGGFVAAGVVPSVKADETEGWVVRTDAYGDETWRGPFTCPGTLVLTGIVAVSTGNFILSGIATVYDAELEADTDRGWMCKIDATGEVVWSRTYSEGNREQFNGVAETSDGGLIFAGSIEKPLPETPEDEQREAWLLKTDSQGYKEWSQTYPLEYGSWAYSVQEEPGGGYAAVGEVEIERNVTVVSNALLLRTDASGVLDWAQAIGDTHDAYAVRCTGLADGGYALGGVQGDAPWMAVTDANGTVQWFRALGLDSAGCVFSIQQLLDGGYVVAGANAPGADTAHPGFAAIVNAEGTVTEETTLVENAARMYGVQTCSDGSLIYAGVMEDVPGACLYRLDAATFGE